MTHEQIAEMLAAIRECRDALAGLIKRLGGPRSSMRGEVAAVERASRTICLLEQEARTRVACGVVPSLTDPTRWRVMFGGDLMAGSFSTYEVADTYLRALRDGIAKPEREQCAP